MYNILTLFEESILNYIQYEILFGHIERKNKTHIEKKLVIVSYIIKKNNSDQGNTIRTTPSILQSQELIILPLHLLEASKHTAE